MNRPRHYAETLTCKRQTHRSLEPGNAIHIMIRRITQAVARSTINFTLRYRPNVLIFRDGWLL